MQAWPIHDRFATVPPAPFAPLAPAPLSSVASLAPGRKRGIVTSLDEPQKPQVSRMGRLTQFLVEIKPGLPTQCFSTFWGVN